MVKSSSSGLRMRLCDFRDFVWPEVLAGRAPRLRSSFKVSCHTRVVYFNATCGIVTNLRLEHNVATDVTLFHLVLVHCSDVSVHLDNTSGGQHVFTPFHVQPPVLHQSVQEVLRLTLLQFFGGQAVGPVEDVRGRGAAALRVNDQVHCSSEQLQLIVSIV